MDPLLCVNFKFKVFDPQLPTSVNFKVLTGIQCMFGVGKLRKTKRVIARASNIREKWRPREEKAAISTADFVR